MLWYEGATLTDRRSLQTDHQGSVVSVADASGALIAINAYDEYGIPQNSLTGATEPQGRFAYTGQAWIPELGMYHYKARLYSPTLGRFLQTDPIGYEDQFNLYAYVGSDPVNGRDPTGMQTVPGSENIDFEKARRTISDFLKWARLDDLPEHIANRTTGLPPTLSGGGNLASTPLKAVNAARLTIVARTAARIESRAASLAARAGGNSVTVKIAGGFNRVDLAGKAHYSKELGRYVSTPHVQFYKENIVDGVVRGISKVGDVVPATMKDIRAVEKVIESLNK